MCLAARRFQQKTFARLHSYLIQCHRNEILSWILTMDFVKLDVSFLSHALLGSMSSCMQELI